MISIHSSHQPIPSLRPQRSDTASAPEKNAATSKPSKETTTTQQSADPRMVQQLAARDREVRSHEQAHLSAAGGLAHGGASFKFTQGPDGRHYATSGEVSIDVSPVANDPQATISKAQKITRAALAPANPSQADRAVASRANAMAIEARVELQRAARDDTDAAESERTSDEPGNKLGANTTPSNPYARPIEALPHTIDTAA